MNNKPFEDILGNTGELKLVEYLLPFEELEFDVDELSEDIERTRDVVINIATKFVNWGILKVRNEEDKTYYRINYESSIVKSIVQLNNAIIENILGDEILYEIHDYLKAKKPNTEDVSVPQIGQVLNTNEIEPKWLDEQNAWRGVDWGRVDTVAPILTVSTVTGLHSNEMIT